MRNSLSLISIMLVIILLVVGCSSKSNSTTSSGSSNEVKKESVKKVALTLSIWGNESYKKKVEEVAKKYTDQHPHVSLEVMLIPYADYQQKLSIMSASNTQPDLVWMADRMLPQFIEAKQLADISEITSDADYDFEDNMQSGFNTLKKDGKLYGVPFTNPPKVLFYNKTMFANKGLKTPLEHYAAGTWTYDEFLSSAKALTDSSKGIYGSSLVTSNGWKLWADNLVDTIWAFGADFLSSDGQQFVMNSPEGAQVLQLFSDMMFKDKIHPKPGDQTMFETGKIGMSRQNYGYKNTLVNVTDFEWDIAPMPKGPVADAPVADGVAAYSVMENSKNKQEAIGLLKFMTSKEGMISMSELFMPNRTSILSSGVLTENKKAPTQEGLQAAIIDVLNGKSRSNFNHLNWQQIDITTQIAMDRLYTQSSDVQTVLDIMTKEITALLK